MRTKSVPVSRKLTMVPTTANLSLWLFKLEQMFFITGVFPFLWAFSQNWPISGWCEDIGWVFLLLPPPFRTKSRPERWIVTIPSSDQWLATIGNHWKTIVSNGWRTIKPLKNHCYQWFLDPKTIGKPLLPMVLVTKNHWKNHWYQWWLSIQSFNGKGEYKNVLNVAMVIITKPIILCWEN